MMSIWDDVDHPDDPSAENRRLRKEIEQARAEIKQLQEKTTGLRDQIRRLIERRDVLQAENERLTLGQYTTNALSEGKGLLVSEIVKRLRQGVDPDDIPETEAAMDAAADYIEMLRGGATLTA